LKADREEPMDKVEGRGKKSLTFFDTNVLIAASSLTILIMTSNASPRISPPVSTKPDSP
jgi:hypothetical protein